LGLKEKGHAKNAESEKNGLHNSLKARKLYKNLQFLMITSIFVTCADLSTVVKRLISIVVLNIFLLNVLGYYGVLLGMKVKSGVELADKLDSNMEDVGATMTFKVPLTVPYGVDSKSYERVDGAFEKDGDTYRLVKQRLLKDTLYIVCIKDVKTTQINHALEDFVQSFAGHEDDSQQTIVTPSLIKDYVVTEIALTASSSGLVLEVAKASAPHYFFDSYFASIVHPPDRLV
jgi:hypothetical protein